MKHDGRLAKLPDAAIIGMRPSPGSGEVGEIDCQLPLNIATDELENGMRGHVAALRQGDGALINEGGADSSCTFQHLRGVGGSDQPFSAFSGRRLGTGHSRQTNKSGHIGWPSRESGHTTSVAVHMRAFLPLKRWASLWDGLLIKSSQATYPLPHTLMKLWVCKCRPV